MMAALLAHCGSTDSESVGVHLLETTPCNHQVSAQPLAPVFVCMLMSRYCNRHKDTYVQVQMVTITASASATAAGHGVSQARVWSRSSPIDVATHAAAQAEALPWWWVGYWQRAAAWAWALVLPVMWLVMTPAAEVSCAPAKIRRDLAATSAATAAAVAAAAVARQQQMAPQGPISIV